MPQPSSAAVCGESVAIIHCGYRANALFVVRADVIHQDDDQRGDDEVLDVLVGQPRGRADWPLRRRCNPIASHRVAWQAHRAAAQRSARRGTEKRGVRSGP